MSDLPNPPQSTSRSVSAGGVPSPAPTADSSETSQTPASPSYIPPSHSHPTQNPAPSSSPPRRKLGLWDRIRRNAREILNENKILLFFTGFTFAFLLAFFWNNIFVLIRSGEAGVIYRPLVGGTDIDETWGEGLQIVAPWNRLFIYNVRVQQVADAFTVLSADGLSVKIEVSMRFRPNRPDLGWLHKEIGPDYVEKVVKPEVQAQFRFVLGQYKPEQIYTSQGFIVQTARQGALAQLRERYVVLDDLLLKSVTLPQSVADSIESKLRAQQLSKEYEYRIDVETLEKERKKIEAEGIRNFQEIITAGGISDSYLRFRGIQATLELAKSPNAKVIVIGGGKDGMPLILDGRSDGNLPAIEPNTIDKAKPAVPSTTPKRTSKPSP
jgi:regulator of protease activity HflC (stomatin/prohibitin superfamily)